MQKFGRNICEDSFVIKRLGRLSVENLRSMMKKFTFMDTKAYMNSLEAAYQEIYTAY